MVVNGIVKNMRKFGVFVEIGGGVVGLLHVEDISVSRIKSPEERFFNGQKINVMIKSIDKDNNKIVLSYKELLGNWDENIKEYSEKTVVEGIVKEADKFKNGIFIELKPNLVGLAEYKEGVEYGQKVNVYIKKIIKERKKIKLLII
jgi:small subunit ribosomal protein S1